MAADGDEKQPRPGGREQVSAALRLRGERLVLRPVVVQDGEALRAILYEPEVARWWSTKTDKAWPFDDDPKSRRWAMVLEGAIVGLIQDVAETDPDYRCVSIDLFVSSTHRGKGLGPEALRTLIGHVIEADGHHRVTIDPHLENAPAIRAYEKVGFQPVGVMRRYTRDPESLEWVDGLLMDLLAEEFSAV